MNFLLNIIHSDVWIREERVLLRWKIFLSQLLAEERIVEYIVTKNPSYLTAMHTTFKSIDSATLFSQSYRETHGYNSYDNDGYRSFDRSRGNGKFTPG